MNRDSEKELRYDCERMKKEEMGKPENEMLIDDTVEMHLPTLKVQVPFRRA